MVKIEEELQDALNDIYLRLIIEVKYISFLKYEINIANLKIKFYVCLNYNTSFESNVYFISKQIENKIINYLKGNEKALML